MRVQWRPRPGLTARAPDTAAQSDISNATHASACERIGLNVEVNSCELAAICRRREDS
jgi:hypothetical protein